MTDVKVVEERSLFLLPFPPFYFSPDRTDPRAIERVSKRLLGILFVLLQEGNGRKGDRSSSLSLSPVLSILFRRHSRGNDVCVCVVLQSRAHRIQQQHCQGKKKKEERFTTHAHTKKGETFFLLFSVSLYPSFFALRAFLLCALTERGEKSERGVRISR